MNSPNHPLTVGSRFGPYRLDRLIGRGGMGEVYQAYDTVKDRTVAIKVLPERLAEDTVYRQRFQRESHAAARLREAHVIPIHDYGEIDGRLYIDMRLVDGDSLRSLLHRHGPGNPSDAVTVVEQVAAALDAAHHDGLLHRDVKPDNILITHQGFVYLVDFGIAQSATDETLTRDGGAVGSYRYMAPERFADVEIGPPSDVYALACVLFECLTGTRPFAGGNDAQIMSAHLFDPIPRPSLVRPTVPATFDAVVARGMAKDPAQRYSTAGELAVAARAALEDGTGGRTPDPSAPASVVRGTGGSGGGSRPGTAPAVSTAVPARTGQAGPHNDPAQAPTAASGTQPNPTPARLDPAPARPDSAGTTTESGTGPTGPSADISSATAASNVSRPRRRLRRIATVLAVLMLVAGSVTFAGWAYLRHTTSGRPVGDAATLQASDIELLGLLLPTGYHRANCVRAAANTQGGTYIVCDPNTAAASPAARFFRFPTASAMHDVYNATYLGVFGATNCPSDPAGKDGPLVDGGKEVGRKACYTDRSTGTPVPAVVVTDEARLVLSVYIWPKTDQTALRDYAARYNYGRLAPNENGRDPDAYTDADRALLGHLNDPYVARNCRHADPPLGPAVAVVRCDDALGAPSVEFIAFNTTDMAKSVYQAEIGQLSGRSCAGTSGNDDVWKQGETVIGRYYCVTDKTGAQPTEDLIAIYDELHVMVELDGVAPDQPGNDPKTDADLNAWFLKNFGK